MYVFSMMLLAYIFDIAIRFTHGLSLYRLDLKHNSSAVQWDYMGARLVKDAHGYGLCNTTRALKLLTSFQIACKSGKALGSTKSSICEP
ncbi:hypothetical protein GOP47_0030235 [Adiantum capillus-veneris]|nr:hypothetical protein GOP47_0030235 [Adiantum capillus-veneris]